MLDSVSSSKGYRPISLRFATTQLQRLDDVIARLAKRQRQQPNRSEVVASLAAERAQQILNGSAVPMLRTSIAEAAEQESTTISVVFTDAQEEIIRRACEGLNQKFSPFVVWAVQTYLEDK